MAAGASEPRWFKGVWDGALNPGWTIAAYNAIEGRVHGACRAIAVWVFEDERFVLAYDQRDMHRVGASIADRFRRDPRHLARTWAALRRLERTVVREGRAVARLAAAADLRAAAPRLAASGDRLHAAFADLFGWASLCEPCGLHLAARLAERCAARFGPETAAVYQARLCAPTFVSQAKREAWARARLAAALAALPTRRRQLGRLPAPLRRALARHAARYGFLRHGYLGAPVTTAAGVLRAARAVTRAPAGESPFVAARRAARDRERLLAAHRLGPEVAFLVRTLDELSRLQDERKRVALLAMGGLDALLGAAARLAGEPPARLRAWLPQEVSRFLRTGEAPDPAAVSARLRGCAVITRDGARRLVVDPRRVAAWRDRVTRLPASAGASLVGTPACRGRAAGPARVLLSARDVGRVRRGDVLVAGNTTPDYMPALRRASAVVTEKGGMTSHAALIARELGIPCLVGVAQVTSRVSDGARLRVDADLGVAEVVA
jgi:phosphohistidine swiveling domain-containing protein